MHACTLVIHKQEKYYAIILVNLPLVLSFKYYHIIYIHWKKDLCAYYRRI